MLIGNYNGTPPRQITILEGIYQQLQDTDIRILYSEGCHLWRRKVSELSMDMDRLSEAIHYNYELTEKRVTVAGMSLLGLEIKLPQAELKYSPANSFAECDETVLEFFGLLKILTELAAVRTIAWRLAREVKKTQRRVNALEKMVIPTARETRVYIESSLEERERESFFTSKLLKKKGEKGVSKKR